MPPSSSQAAPKNAPQLQNSPRQYADPTIRSVTEAVSQVSPVRVNLPNAQDAPRPPKLLDQVREKLRTAHYSIRTESAYVDWIRRFILFHQKKHPASMGVAEIEQFLTYLAVNRTVAPSTQNQALSALLFLYQRVLKTELPQVNAVRAKHPKRLPVVLSVNEVRTLLAHTQSSVPAHARTHLRLRTQTPRMLPTPSQRHRL